MYPLRYFPILRKSTIITHKSHERQQSQATPRKPRARASRSLLEVTYARRRRPDPETPLTAHGAMGFCFPATA